jgi:hypothetical protein
MKGCINFVNSGGGTGGFSHYVFFGGADFTGSGSVITTAPGQYIFAGVQNGGQNNVHVLNVDNAVTIQDQTPTLGGQMTAPSDAGEMFLFTDANYQGGSTQSGLQSLYIPQAVSNCNTCNFVFGDVNIQMGNTAQSQLNLHGLNADPNNGGAALPSSLQSFAPDVFWQDQQNSPLKYDRNGNIVDSTSCGGGGTLDTPCANPNLSPNGTKEVTMAGNDPTTMFTLQATPGLHLYGVLYQPRGSTLNMQGSGNVTTPMVIITGELKMGGSPTVLQPLGAAALAVEQVALVE